MARYSVVEAKDNFSALLDAVEAGEEVVVTRHGKPVVQFVRPLEALADPEWAARRDAAMARLAAFRSRQPLSPVDSVDLIRQMRDEGP